MNPNIAALQAAENLLRDHDAKAKELADEMKVMKKTRATMVARVQECIDVLCGRGTPSLFPDAPPAADPDNPLGPLRDTLLTQIAPTLAGNNVAIYLSVNDETQTLGDLWDWVEEDGAEWGGMRGSGLEMLLGTRKNLTAKERRTFGSLVYSFLDKHKVDMKTKPTGGE